MIPEPCKYTPDVSFVNVTFFNISAFVNSWKRCQPCFNGAQKRTAFKEMAHHRNSQNHKRCQKATFSLYRLAPGNAALGITPSYVPVPADVSLHVGTQGGMWSCQGCPREGEEPDVSPQSVPSPPALMLSEATICFSCCSGSCLVFPCCRGRSAQGEASPLRDLSRSAGWIPSAVRTSHLLGFPGPLYCPKLVLAFPCHYRNLTKDPENGYGKSPLRTFYLLALALPITTASRPSRWSPR